MLIIWIGPLNIIAALKTANWWFILLALGIHLIVLTIRSIRWGFIINQTTEFKKNFIVKTIGCFAGNISPLKTAGEVLTAVAGKNINKIQLSEGLSAGLTERFFDLGIVGILIIIPGLFVPEIRHIALLGGAITLTGTIFVYIINWTENTSVWIYNKIHPIICKLPIKEETLDNIYQKFTTGLQEMINYSKSFKNFKNLTFVVLLTLTSWLLECLRLYTVFYAFHISVQFTQVIIIFLLSSVIGMISLLPGGLGSEEISSTSLFIIFGGVPSALAGSIILTDRLVSYWLINIMGIIFSTYYAKNILNELKKYTLNLQSS